jgi:transposase InsO family protein
MTQEEAVALFHQVHRLARQGMSKTMIARTLSVSRPTVIQWLTVTTYQERRGWRPGRVRKHTDPAVPERICQLKRRRVDDCYLVGSPYVQMDYAKGYPSETVPSLWYIDQVVRAAGLQTRKPRHKRRGGSVYLLYPVVSMKRLGLIQESADFIGRKYLDGCSRPVTIFSSCYYRPFKMYQIYRTEAEKATFAIDLLARQWQEYPRPHVVRMDNGAPFRGTATFERCLGSFLIFLLNLGITPLFGSPSRPWTNGSVEGYNRVFSEKVWQKNRFRSLEEVDRENERFNAEGREFFQFRYQTLATRFAARCLKATTKVRTDMLHTRRNKRISFVRFVEPAADEPRAHIMIMNERVFLPEAYLHQFVFATWDLEAEQLSIVSEYQGSCTPILHCRFKIRD